MAKKPDGNPDRKIVATNRKARHNYSILDTYEAGVVLQGTEVKSLREGHASLADAFATVDDGEIWLRNLHIPEYHHGTWTNHTPNAWLTPQSAPHTTAGVEIVPPTTRASIPSRTIASG